MLSAADLRKLLKMQRERLARVMHRKSRFDRHDVQIRQRVEASGHDAVEMSAALVDYFWRAHQHYVAPAGTLAYYPGHPSIYGARNDAIEGVSRLLPLWATYAGSPYCDPVLGQPMVQHIRQALVNGTDPAHAGYWGPIGHKSTLICEGADIALCLWLSKSLVWDGLPVHDQQAILVWLKQAIGKDTADNNWHLFVVLIDAILADLVPAHRFSSHKRLRRVQDFQLSEGCFKDGPNGQVDFYNAWGFHYLLFWLHEVSGSLVDGFAIDALKQFCGWYQYLFTPNGLPLFGRSLCYRFAACAPLIACASVDPATVSPGVAASAYVVNWAHFVRHGGLHCGRPTQGVFGEDIRWLDPYSGPASSFWGTRSMVLFYFVARKLDWQKVRPAELPSEQADHDQPVDALAAHIQTDARLHKSVVVFNHSPAKMPGIPLHGPGWSSRLRQLLYATASRPANNLQKAGVTRFSSDLDEYR